MSTRRATTRRPAPPAEAGSPDAIAASIVALLGAIEGQPDGSPAAGAYRAALRRKGEALAADGGPAALDDVLARVRACSLGRTNAREAILDTVWSALPRR